MRHDTHSRSASEPDRRAQDVVGDRVAEIERPVAAAHEAAQPVLPAGDLGPAKADRVGQRGERKGQQREIDAAPAQDQRAHHSRQQGDEHDRKKQRQQELPVQPVLLRERRGIGADPEPCAVAD